MLGRGAVPGAGAGRRAWHWGGAQCRGEGVGAGCRVWHWGGARCQGRGRCTVSCRRRGGAAQTLYGGGEWKSISHESREGVAIVALSERWVRGGSIWAVDCLMDGSDLSYSHVH